jgi:hypothetical protein
MKCILKMERLVKLSLILLLLIYFWSCAVGDDRTWDFGAITEPGDYINKKEKVSLQVRIENNLVKYRLSDSLGNEVFRQKRIFSNLHNWAFYLDHRGSIWILSSDIGYAILRKDSTTGTYQYSEFDHFLRPNEVPKELFDDLPEFFD